MGKEGSTTPEGQLHIGYGSPRGNQSEHSRAGIRAIRSTEKGGVFRLSQVLLKQKLACKNDTLQALPSRRHANSKPRLAETARAGSPLIMIGTMGKMVGIKVT
jgi:hypothetical protein